VSLARIQPEAAKKVLPRYIEHATWQVRMYAARAAGVLGLNRELEMLWADAIDNVKEAALGAMIELKLPNASTAAIASLGRNDYQLILTAVRALEDKSNADRATRPLINALGRITAEHKDTSRDPRMAILNRLHSYGLHDAGGRSRGLL
jgi:HEAT repeat protein